LLQFSIILKACFQGQTIELQPEKDDLQKLHEDCGVGPANTVVVGAGVVGAAVVGAGVVGAGVVGAGVVTAGVVQSYHKKESPYLLVITVW